MPFPDDTYTPHGYLDTPSHSRNLTPRGVLRSQGAGFAWHFPAHAGMYGGRRETYRAGVRLALDGAHTIAMFDHATSHYHSKDLVSFDITKGVSRAHVLFQLVGEHVLHAVIDGGRRTEDGGRRTEDGERTTNDDDAQLTLQPPPSTGNRLAILIEYTRLLGANGQWGESGLVGRLVDDRLVLQGFEDGEAFVVATTQPWADLGISSDAQTAAGWAASPAAGLPPEGYLTVIGRRGATVGLHAVLGFGPAIGQLEVFLARGKTVDEACQHLADAQRTAAVERARKVASDAAFWAQAPQLSGDWPAHWRRGLVYDLETVRMMVKSPLGSYRRIWDAMQIQAPRVVLAEAAIDALLLGYADPPLAQALLLATFEDAAAPNVPCSREDGSFNMVAADGTVCGTAPAWGYPFLVAEWLDALHPQPGWRSQIYTHLAAHLDWWLAERRDAAGWLVYACSWESGQDDSPRFGAQPLGGGHPVRHIRPVDLHAAVAHAAGVLARFATRLNRPHDSTRWQTIAAEFVAKTASLWQGEHGRPQSGDRRPGAGESGSGGERETRNEGDTRHETGDSRHETGSVGDKETQYPIPNTLSLRYADYDTRAMAFSPVDDVMLLAPLALQVAGAAAVAALRPALQALDAAELTWPVPTWTVVAAAQAANLPDTAAELAAAVIERAYRYWDAPREVEGQTLPGIACEFWPTNGRCGGEGYGWGAFTTHLLLHTLLGFTPTTTGLCLRPNLPLAWRVPGRQYHAQLSWRGQRLAICIAPLAEHMVAITVNNQREELAWGGEYQVGIKNEEV